MSNSQPTESGFKNWINNLQEKRRVVVLDEESFEEKRNFTTSKFTIFSNYFVWNYCFFNNNFLTYFCIHL